MCGNGNLIMGPSLYDKLPFNPLKDFAPIAQVFVAANILAVHPDVPAKNVEELVALAKAQPDKLNYGHAGIGTSQHLAAELFKYMAKIKIQPVAYRGSTAVLPDLLAGRLSISFSNVVNVLPLVREGKLRGFAVSSRKRSSVAPELPTMAELGYPGFEAVPWFGLLAPAGTPQAIVDKVHRETVRVLALPDVRKRIAELGLDAIGNSPSEFAAVIAKEIPEWGKIIKEAGIKASE
jgi:tripartite-type tricarboxylate transporter receptor subunit TctC